MQVEMNFEASVEIGDGLGFWLSSKLSELTVMSSPDNDRRDVTRGTILLWLFPKSTMLLRPLTRTIDLLDEGICLYFVSCRNSVSKGRLSDSPILEVQ